MSVILRFMFYLIFTTRKYLFNCIKFHEFYISLCLYYVRWASKFRLWLKKAFCLALC